MKRQRLRKGIVLVSFLLLPLTLYFFSPVLIIEGAAQGLVTGSFVLFGLLLVSSLFLRRGFCGWLCPGAGLQEASFMASDRRVRGGRYDWIKYGIWIPWIGTIFSVAIGSGGLRRIDTFFNTPYGTPGFEAKHYVIYAIVYFTVIALITVPALAVGRRAFCHYLCWMAPFMVIGTKLRDMAEWPALQLVVDRSKCNNCPVCTKNCPMSLDVIGMVRRGSMANSECILCGTCADNCPKGAIRYSFRSGN